jgi:hypothetical protein
LCFRSGNKLIVVYSDRSWSKTVRLFRHASSCFSLISPRYSTVRCCATRRHPSILHDAKVTMNFAVFYRRVLRRNIHRHDAKIYRARKRSRSSPQRYPQPSALMHRDLSPPVVRKCRL